LNFRSLGVWFLLGILGLDFPPDYKLSDVVLFGQVEKLANLAGPFRPKTFRVSNVGNARDIGFALLDNHNRKDREIRTDNATTDGFTFAFASTTRSVATVSLGKEQTYSCGMEDTLCVKLETREHTFFIGNPCLSFPPVTLKT
jgi:hypothetical protein